MMHKASEFIQIILKGDSILMVYINVHYHFKLV